MDTEKQARLDFLEEAEEYFDNLESLLMDLEAQGAEPNILDTAMRAAHSLKGGAGMMRLPVMGKIAHCLEDFFKILRVRKDNSLVNKETTTLLLQGIDCLRTVRNLYQANSLADSWFSQNAEPVFDALRAILGDLSEEDEDKLLAEEEQIDVSTMLFQSGVEDCLESFEAQIDILEPAQLKTELGVRAEELGELGLMSQIEPFVQLCESVKQQLEIVSLADIKNLAREALKLWERSHALVLVGRMDRLPSQIGVNELQVEIVADSPDIADIVDAQELTAIQNFTAQQLSEEFSETNTNLDLDELSLNGEDLLAFNEAFAEVDIPNVDSAPNLDEFALDAAELSDLNAAFAEVDIPNVDSAPDLNEFALDTTELSDLNAAFAEVDLDESSPEPEAPEIVVSTPDAIANEPKKQDKSRMVRVAAERLENLNNLSSKLILERNAAILRLNQLQNFVSLTKQRMRRLEQSSQQLRKLYDWAALEGMMPTNKTEPVAVNTVWQSTSSSSIDSQTDTKFDALEMDRYSDLHLLSQEQMETIVQLQEVTADMDLGIQEMGRVIHDLSYTTQELQQNVTRSQMRPFSELVGRFPRLIRDLSNKHHKQVNLKIEGETTYIDRQAVELLGDPLTHLLRNAFDHGLETTETRLAAGKPATGEITLKAWQKGNQTLITISDDGGGINTEKIRARLLKLGFTADEVAQIPQTDLLDAIFEPGFSTAEQVTELSGRGVGMDVVRSNLQQIRGDIQVKTELGQGTTFTISVPLSLLVLRVVIVESAGMVFAVPVNSIKQIVHFDPEIVTQNEQQEQIHWGEESIDIVRLQQHLKFLRPHKSFEMLGTAKIDTPTVLIFEGSDRQQGIYLEKYWNEQEVAIRPIKTSVSLFPGLTGSTILGDGRVIPLIEPNALIRGFERQLDLSTEVNSIDSENTNPFTFSVSDARTIMIVDDSVHIRRYLARFLELNGYRVEEAKDGQDAIDKLKAGLQVQAVICDVEMPRLDGYGVLSEIQFEPSWQNLPVIMLTSRSNTKHRSLAMQLGASAYFSKPFNEQEMLQTLKSLIAS